MDMNIVCLIMNKSTRKNLIFQKAKAFLIANM